MHKRELPGHESGNIAVATSDFDDPMRRARLVAQQAPDVSNEDIYAACGIIFGCWYSPTRDIRSKLVGIGHMKVPLHVRVSKF